MTEEAVLCPHHVGSRVLGQVARPVAGTLLAEPLHWLLKKKITFVFICFETVLLCSLVWPGTWLSVVQAGFTCLSVLLPQPPELQACVTTWSLCLLEMSSYSLQIMKREHGKQKPCLCELGGRAWVILTGWKLQRPRHLYLLLYLDGGYFVAQAGLTQGVPASACSVFGIAGMPHLILMECAFYWRPVCGSWCFIRWTVIAGFLHSELIFKA